MNGTDGQPQDEDAVRPFSPFDRACGTGSQLRATRAGAPRLPSACRLPTPAPVTGGWLGTTDASCCGVPSSTLIP